MTYHRIHLWGDSLSKGVVYDETRGRYCITPERFVIQLEDGLGVPIVNHSRMGATLPEGLRDFLATEPDSGAIAVIEYGGNDCDMPWAEVSANPEEDYQGKIPLGDFTQGLYDFIDAVRARGMEPLLVTPTPLEASRYFEWVTKGLSQEAVLRFLGDVQHIYRWQERYSIAIRNVAVKACCALFDMRDVFLAQRRYPDLFCADGIHPNAEGHALIAQAALQQKDALRTQLKSFAAV